MHAGGLKCKLAAGACKQIKQRRASELGQRKNKSNDALTREQANTHTHTHRVLFESLGMCVQLSGACVYVCA